MHPVPRSNSLVAWGRRRAAFTLIEFILVMALLAGAMAFSAPLLSRFFRQRHLEDEATRFLALTEYGRNEAVSQGFPMVVWIHPESQQYGLEPDPGFPLVSARSRVYTLHQDVRFELETRPDTKNGLVDAATFGPDGALALESLQALSLIDRQGEELIVAQTTNGWGYEILKPSDYVSRNQRR